MSHACVRRFNVTGTVGIFLETKQGLSESYNVGDTLAFSSFTPASESSLRTHSGPR